MKGGTEGWMDRQTDRDPATRLSPFFLIFGSV